MDSIDVLVIDDEPIVLALVRRVLSSTRYAVTCASSGTEGLARLGEREFAAVVVDLKMPDVGGLEVVRWVKRKHPRCVTIVLTGHATMEVAQQLMHEGCDDLLLKPMSDPLVVARTLDRCLERRRLVQAIESLEQLDDSHQAVLGLAAGAMDDLSEACAALTRRLAELHVTDERPDVASLCARVDDGLRRLAVAVAEQTDDGLFRPR